MKIYTLTITKTQESFSPVDVKTFVSHDKAHKAMIESVHDVLKSINVEVPIEELDSPNGYEYNGISVGYDYAQIDSNFALWDIFTTELTSREVIIGNIMSYIHETYKTPSRFDDVIYRLINENDVENFTDISVEDFVQDVFIGESLYQNALAQLGGKTDEYSTGKIIEYLNESDQFTNVRCETFGFWDLPVKEEELDSLQRWIIGMLCICDGNNTMINLVREDIDDRQPKGSKIFVKETKMSFVESHASELPQNHRQLCSSLNDEQYYDIMSFIFNYNYHFGSPKNLYEKMAEVYSEMEYIVHKIIKTHGIDVLLEEYGYMIEIIDGYEHGWYVALIGDPYEVSSGIDELKSEYKELFN